MNIKNKGLIIVSIFLLFQMILHSKANLVLKGQKLIFFNTTNLLNSEPSMGQNPELNLTLKNQGTF